MPERPADVPVVVALDEAAERLLRSHAADAGVSPAELAARWLAQRLEVEEALRRGRGGPEQLVRLVQAIERVEPPDA